VDQGTDTVGTSAGDGIKSGDVLKVSSGAKAVAPNIGVSDDFVATAATSNDGADNTAAKLTAVVDGATTIDVSKATGSAGFTLNGGAGPNDGDDLLVGSEKDDVINGGNDNQGTTTHDTLTGNGGGDIFKFDVSISTPTAAALVTTTPGVDQEMITVTADGVDSGNESLTITYAVNGIAGAVLVNDPAINFADAAAVASAIVTALDAVNGISATIGNNNNEVLVTGDQVTAANGVVANNSISLIPSGGGATVGGDTTTLAAAYSDGSDVAQVTTLTYFDPVTAGEKYDVLAKLVEGQEMGSSVNAAGPGAGNVATAQAAAYNAVDSSTQAPDPQQIIALAGGTVVTFTDNAPDNGGFNLTSTEKGSLIGTGASAFQNLMDLDNADVITDFVSGTDKISFGLVAGELANYKAAAGVDTFAEAHTAADDAMNGTVRYYLTSINNTVDPTEPDGVLFFDANADGTADGVVQLIGIDMSSFVATDIIV